MCVDNISAGIANAAVSVLSSAVSFKKTQDESEILLQEAQTARDNAAIETQEGIEEARRIKLKSILAMGDEKTQIASGNIMTTSGTALNAINSAKINGDVEALSTLKSSKTSAQKYLTQSELLMKKASLNTTSSLIGGISNVLSSAAKNFFSF